MDKTLAAKSINGTILMKDDRMSLKVYPPQGTHVDGLGLLARL